MCGIRPSLAAAVCPTYRLAAANGLPSRPANEPHLPHVPASGCEWASESSCQRTPFAPRTGWRLLACLLPTSLGRRGRPNPDNPLSTVQRVGFAGCVATSSRRIKKSRALRAHTRLFLRAHRHLRLSGHEVLRADCSDRRRSRTGTAATRKARRLRAAAGEGSEYSEDRGSRRIGARGLRQGQGLRRQATGGMKRCTEPAPCSCRGRQRAGTRRARAATRACAVVRLGVRCLPFRTNGKRRRGWVIGVLERVWVGASMGWSIGLVPRHTPTCPRSRAPPCALKYVTGLSTHGAGCRLRAGPSSNARSREAAEQRPGPTTPVLPPVRLLCCDFLTIRRCQQPSVCAHELRAPSWSHLVAQGTM